MKFLGEGPKGDAVRLPRLDALTVRNAAPLRTCATIVGDDEGTQLVETSEELAACDVDELWNGVDAMAENRGRAECVCVVGSMPPGYPLDTYADLTRGRMKDSLVLIDSIAAMAPSSATRRRNDRADARKMEGGKEKKYTTIKHGGGGDGHDKCWVPLRGNH